MVTHCVTAITLGQWSPSWLDATYPHTPGAPSTCAYLVLLRVEIARFTPGGLSCDTPPGLVSVALILTSRWTAVSCYAALCSPDVPPVRLFSTCTGGGLVGFTGVIIQANPHCFIHAAHIHMVVCGNGCATMGHIVAPPTLWARTAPLHTLESSP